MVHPGQELFVPLTHTGRPGAERVSGDDDDLAAYVTGTADPESLRYLVERPDTRHLDVEFSPVGQIREPGCFVSVRAYPDDSTTVGEHIVVHGRHVGAVRCQDGQGDRKSTRLNSSHVSISYAVFCLKNRCVV